MNRPDAAQVIGRIIAWAAGRNIGINLNESINNTDSTHVTQLPTEEMAAQSDIIISLGGDGTMLSSARAVGSHGTPILGINLGSLGFLTQLTPVGVEETLDSIAQRKFYTEPRMVCEVDIEGEQELAYTCALNDVVIDRGSVSRMIHLDLYANDHFICSYAADGLIISTPTGSTAYTLAVGGPIVNPLLSAFIASPISAFSLTTRPILFSGEDELRVVARSKHSAPVVTLDGQVSCRLADGDSVTVKKADFVVNFIVFRHNSFYDVLRNKLHWGRLPEGRPGDRPKYY